VTNWHNLSGKNLFTGVNISPTGGLPNRVKVYLNSKGRIGDKFSKIFDLDDKHGTPKWLAHPSQIVDIAMLPLWPKEEPDWYAMNQLEMLDLSVAIGQNVYILSYSIWDWPKRLPDMEAPPASPLSLSFELRSSHISL
jgi:hypothetical protein